MTSAKDRANTDSKISLWQLEDALRKFGPYQYESIKDEALRTVVQRLGGWERLCEMSYEQLRSAYVIYCIGTTYN